MTSFLKAIDLFAGLGGFTFGSVCSGIEAASVAWHPLGWRAEWLAEIEPFPSAVLAHHYPDVPNLGDMTALPELVRLGAIPAPDVLVGGTPCQAFSVAGLRGGLSDKRGALTLSFVELANAIDSQRPDDECVIVWENVPGVLSSKDNAFGCFIAGLAGEDDPLEPSGGRWADAGYVHGPQRSVAWRVLDAQYFGLAQRRRRVFVVASAREGFDPAAVLFERDGMRRDSAPSREAGKAVTALTANGVGACGADDNQGQEGHLIASTGDISHCLNAGGMGRQDYETETMVVQPVAFHPTQDPISSTDVSHSMGCGSSGGQASVAVCVTGYVTHTLKAEGFDASEDGTGRGQPIVPAVYPILEVGKRTGASTTDPRAGLGIGGSYDPMFTLQAGAQHGVGTAMQVRRLTPRECERLQGFPDDWTDVPYRGKPAADGPRYKALGNSMAVPCMRWIGERIERQRAASRDLPVASKYSIIYADPPWSYADKCNSGKRGAGHKYQTMTDAELAALPVDGIAADDCALFMWATFPRLGAAIQLMADWGFTYKTCAFVWVKKSEAGKLAWGMGNWTRANAEIVLLGIKGKPKRIDCGVHQIIEAPRREHSRKPDEARDRIVALMGDVPRIELFARQSAPGWDSWGNESTKFDKDQEAA